MTTLKQQMDRDLAKNREVEKRSVDKTLAKKVVDLRVSGKNINDISKELKISLVLVHKIINNTR